MIDGNITIKGDYLLMTILAVLILLCLWCLRNIVFATVLVAFSGAIAWEVYNVKGEWDTAAFVGLFVLFTTTGITAAWKPCKRRFFGEPRHQLLG